MTDIDIEGATSQVRTRLESLDFKVVAAIALAAVCVGVWIGFKVAGGTVAGVAAPTSEPDCGCTDTEATILSQDVAE